jgi:hypothetical protein
MTHLRPGLHVVRRDDHHLQVGIDPPWRAVLPDEPEVQRLLEDLAAGRPPAPTGPASHRALLALERAGMLIEADPPPGTPAARVSVHGPAEPAAEAARLLQAAGLSVGTTGADVALLIARGELCRGDVDAHVRDGRPHLMLARTARGHVLGPFVVPGETACLRCVDAHLGEHDPRRAVVVEQVTGLETGVVDPVLESLATAWAVRDLLTYAAGGCPSTWSATVTLGPDLEPRRTRWARHPHCGCSWADEVAG